MTKRELKLAQRKEAKKNVKRILRTFKLEDASSVKIDELRKEIRKEVITKSFRTHYTLKVSELKGLNYEQGIIKLDTLAKEMHVSYKRYDDAFYGEFSFIFINEKWEKVTKDIINDNQNKKVTEYIIKRMSELEEDKNFIPKHQWKYLFESISKYSETNWNGKEIDERGIEKNKKMIREGFISVKKASVYSWDKTTKTVFLNPYRIALREIVLKHKNEFHQGNRNISTRNRDKMERKNQYDYGTREYRLIERMKEIKENHDWKMKNIAKNILFDDEKLSEMSSSIKSELKYLLQKAILKLS